MQVDVITPTGVFTLPGPYNPNVSIHTIKQHISSRNNVAVDDMHIYSGVSVGRARLMNPEKLSDCAVYDKNRVVLTMVVSPAEKYFSITVNQTAGGYHGQYTLEGAFGDQPVSLLKKCIQDRSMVPAEDFKIIFDGKELVDSNATLEECGLQHAAVIYVFNCDHTIGVNANYDTKPYKGSHFFTNLQKKTKLWEFWNLVGKVIVPMTPFKVIFGGKELTDSNATLEECGLYHGAVVAVIDSVSSTSTKPFSVTIKQTFRTLSREYILEGIYSNHLVATLQDRIRDRSNVHPGNFKIIFAGKHLANGNTTMEECGIREGAVIFVVDWDNKEATAKQFEITAKYVDNGQSISMRVRSCDTLLSIMARIGSSLNLTFNRFKLIHKGKELVYQSYILEEYGIFEGSTIEVVILKEIPAKKASPSEFDIFIKYIIGGKLVKLFKLYHLRNNDHVDYLKRHISNSIGLPVRSFKVNYNGFELRNPTQTMEQWDISKDDTIDVVALEDKMTEEREAANNVVRLWREGRQSDSYHKGVPKEPLEDKSPPARKLDIDPFSHYAEYITKNTFKNHVWEIYKGTNAKPAETEEQRLLTLRDLAARSMALGSTNITKDAYMYFGAQLKDLYARAKAIRRSIHEMTFNMQDAPDDRAKAHLQWEYNELSMELARLVGK